MMMANEGQKADDKWFVYVLRCADNSLYTGITNNLEKRMHAHASGTASKYTRSRRPVALMARSGSLDKVCAMRLEIQIKKTPRAGKLDVLLASSGSANFSTDGVPTYKP